MNVNQNKPTKTSRIPQNTKHDIIQNSVLRVGLKVAQPKNNSILPTKNKTRFETTRG
jgi:hypothetical protein